MALTIRTLRDQEEEARVAGSFTLTERVCLNSDKTDVVNCNSEAACFSLGGLGTQIPMADAERYGLVAKAAPEEKPGPPEFEDKMVRPVVNGRRRKAKD